MLYVVWPHTGRQPQPLKAGFRRLQVLQDMVKKFRETVSLQWTFEAIDRHFTGASLLKPEAVVVLL